MEAGFEGASSVASAASLSDCIRPRGAGEAPSRPCVVCVSPLWHAAYAWPQHYFSLQSLNTFSLFTFDYSISPLPSFSP